MVQEGEVAYPRDARRRHAHDRRGSTRATRRRRCARQKYARDPKKYARGMRDARDEGHGLEEKTRLTDLMNGMRRLDPLECVDDVSNSCFAAFGVLGHSSS